MADLAAIKLKNSNNETANPATDEILTKIGLLLDRLEFGLITDNSKRLKVVVDSGGTITGVTTVGTVTSLGTVSTVTNVGTLANVTTVATVTNLGTVANVTNLGTLANVTNVGTVATVGNQSRIGDVQAQRVVEAALDTAFNFGIIRNLSF
jgi:hypothetical protein